MDEEAEDAPHGSGFWLKKPVRRPSRMRKIVLFAGMATIAAGILFINVWGAVKIFSKTAKRPSGDATKSSSNPGATSTEESEIGRSNYSGKNQPNIVVSPLTSPAISPVQTAVADDWHVYKNMDYNFKVQFSDIWQGYLVEKKGDYAGPAEVVLEVKLPSVTPAIPLTFYIYKLDKWKEDDGTTEIIRNARYVYAYKMWEGPPLDPNTLPDKEIGDAIRLFELI